MSLDILEEIIKFLLQGIKDLKIKRLLLILHGGEPLLMPRSQFSLICISNGIPLANIEHRLMH